MNYKGAAANKKNCLEENKGLEEKIGLEEKNGLKEKKGLEGKEGYEEEKERWKRMDIHLGGRI